MYAPEQMEHAAVRDLITNTVITNTVSGGQFDMARLCPAHVILMSTI